MKKPPTLKFVVVEVVHVARLLWRDYGRQSLLICKDFRFLGLPLMFPTGNEGECLFIDHSTYMYYASWPVNAPLQIQYTFASLRGSKSAL